MSFQRTIAALLAPAAGAAERHVARVAWAKAAADRWYEAQKGMDERCAEACERLSEEEFERLFEAEQAKVDAIRAEIDDAIDHDRWPRHLYFGEI